MTPQTVGRYRIEARIATGGMGEVYRALVEGVGGISKPIAIKLVRQDMANQPDFAALFVEEVKVAMALSHANIVQAFDVGQVDNRWFLAMEFIDGVDLGDLIPPPGLPLDIAIYIAIEVLKGLDYAHRRQAPDGTPLSIVHRDVSPGNVLVSAEGEVKLADFGVAKSALRDVGSVMGTLKGKIPYMPPEQVRGAVVDHRVDIYALGAVLFEMVTGRRLFKGDGPALVPEILSGVGQALLGLQGSVPHELINTLRRALATDPAVRHPTAGQLRQELERIAHANRLFLTSSSLTPLVDERRSLARARTQPGDSNVRASTDRGIGPSAGAGVEQRQGVESGFDELLGRELRKVSADRPHSVYTLHPAQDDE